MLCLTLAASSGYSKDTLTLRLPYSPYFGGSQPCPRFRSSCATCTQQTTTTFSRCGSVPGLPVRAEGRDRADRLRPTDGVRPATRHRAARRRHVGRRRGADPRWPEGLDQPPRGRSGIPAPGFARRLVAEAERWFAQDVGLEVWAALIERHNGASLSLFDELGYGQPDVAYVSKRLWHDA